LPAPNLRGDYEGACVACLRGTDAGIGLAGTARFVAAAIRILGVPIEDARLIVVMETGNDDLDEQVTRIVQLCAACARKSGLGIRVGLVPDGVPFYGEPGVVGH
jgi:hypothetical protein